MLSPGTTTKSTPRQSRRKTAPVDPPPPSPQQGILSYPAFAVRYLLLTEDMLPAPPLNEITMATEEDPPVQPPAAGRKGKERAANPPPRSVVCTCELLCDARS